jgi:group I intron endonuclease
MARGIIYLITNKENGLKYVGSTLLPMNKEWQSHIQLSNKMSPEPLHRAFRQYGVHRFGIQELDECDERELDDKREQWIRHYNSYNGENYNFRIFDEEEEDDEEDLIPIVPDKVKQVRHLHTFTNQDRRNIKRTGHKVQGKHLETGEIKIWESAALAAEEVTGNARKNSNIMSCARNCYRCYGYKWSVVEENSKKKSVFGIHKKTERLGPRYESITEAMKALRGNSAGVGLIKSLKHPGRYSYRGFYWYYG